MALTQSQIDKILKGIHSGNIDIDNIPNELSAFTYSELMTFVQSGFGKLDSVLKTTKMELYQGNISAFSGAKTFQEVKDLTLFTFNPDGSKRPFKEFKEFASDINNKYNKVWLKTEQDTAFGVAQGADQWIDIENEKDLFPMLQYQTALDERVRHEHAEWDGIKRPVDDSFWDTRMPVNGFNCRCTVIKLTEGKKTSLKGVPKNSSEQFSNNPGKVDYIFDPKKHPYFKHTKSEDKAFKKAVSWNKDIVPPVGNAKTIRDAKQQFKDVFKKGTGITPKSVSINNDLGLDSINRRNKQLNTLFNEYDIASVYNKNATPQIKYNSSKKYHGFVSSNHLGGKSNLGVVNFGHTTDKIRAGGGILSKAKVDSINNDIATLTHEFGHLITVDRQSLLPDSSKIQGFWSKLNKIRGDYSQELIKFNKAKSTQDIEKIHLGRYAHTNRNEFMAEAFTEYKLNSNPSKYASQVGELIDETFKKK